MISMCDQWMSGYDRYVRSVDVVVGGGFADSFFM